MRRIAALAVALTVVGATLDAQLIDRVLAVVSGAPITLSDVNAAMTFGLVTPTPGASDPIQSALDQLIDRQLQLVEVNRYGPAEPAAAAIDAQLAAIRQRFSTEAAFTTALTQTGITERQLRAAIRDSLRIDSYLEQRFGGNYQPGDAELTRYYRAHEADFTRNGTLAPFETVREEVRRHVIAERTSGLLRNWVSDLRRRNEVTILPK
jgi:parvulin-like peptidyl-prolyl isomerase